MWPDPAMLFTTLHFAVFFALTLFLYTVVPNTRARIWIILVASAYFYCSWNASFFLLLLGQTGIDFWVARQLDQTQSPTRRRAWVALMVTTNLSVLFFFKYWNFFGATFSGTLPRLNVVLPLGISFYTFEGISYGIDVYRRRLPAHTSLLDYWVFISFFPHLIAGPIVRAADFLPQLKTSRALRHDDLLLGGQRLAIGAFKKLVIADNLSAVADQFFSNPHTSSATAWLAVSAYTLQIYCDFSGYSDMAIGAARMMGLHLTENFNWPYLSRSISDFWHRWHMSLSSWLRDYLYIPLGGSRKGPLRTYVNLLITMTLGGLWHGANWTFVIWGVYHGALLMSGRWLAVRVPRAARILDSPLGTLLTLLQVMVGWVIFRSQTIEEARSILRLMFTFKPGVSLVPDYIAGNVATILSVFALVHIGAWIVPPAEPIRRTEPLSTMHRVRVSATCGILLAAILSWMYRGMTNPFIYFQF